jgi:hypothetical protein
MVLAVVVVVERVGDPDTRPAGLQNPFRDVKLPESSSGTADGRGHQVPTSDTQSAVAPSSAEVRTAVPQLPGTVGRTVNRPVQFEEPGKRPAEATVGAAKPGPVELPEAAREGRPRAGRVERSDLRSETADVFQNPDGTFTSEFSVEPKRFRGGDGAWVDVDTKLVAGGPGRLRAHATESATDLARSADDARLGRLELGDGMSIGFGIEGAAAAQAQVKGSRATYAGVRPSSDVELWATPTGVKEIITLRSADAPTRWVFPLDLAGLTAKVEGQQVLLIDGSGTAQAVIPPGWMEDSGTTGPAGSHATSPGVTYSLVTAADGRQALQIDLDAQWLAAEERVFPVRVDPTVTTLQAWADDTYVSSANPTTNFSSQWVLKVGRYLSDVNRGYINWVGQPQLTGVNVLNVNVKLFNWLSASCTPYPVRLHEVMQSWDGTTMPWPGAAIGPEVAQKTFSHSNIPACPGAWESFSDSRLTQLVEDWARGVKVNTGLAVRVSETDGQQYKEFYSQSSLYDPADPVNFPNLRPQMDVTWTPYGATYGWGANPPVWEQQLTATQQGKIRVNITNTGRDAWPANGQYKLSYKIYDAANTNEIVSFGYATNLPAQVNPGGSYNLLATVNPLPPGNYVIRWDMIDWVGANVTWFSAEGVPYWGATISVGNVPPVVTGATPLNGEKVNTLRPVLSLTGSDPDATPGAMTYSFQICTGSDANSGQCWNSGGSPIASSTWQVPADALYWSQNYYWRGKVTDGSGGQSLWTSPIRLYTQVAAPQTTSHFGRDPYAPSVAGVTPVVGNYTTATTDASVAGVGPTLSLTRSYNSRNTEAGMFGAGWTSEWDMSAEPDAVGEGNLLVRYPDGRQARFGRNWDGTYASQDGYFSVVQAPAPRVDSFTGDGSSSSLGVADTGETWSVLAGTWGVSNGDAYLASSAGVRNVAVIPGAADGTVRFTAPVAQDKVGVAFRVQDADNMWMLYVKPSASQLVLAKRSGGTETTVATASNACCAAGDTYAVTMSGSQLTVLRNNQVVATATDSAFSTSTRAGVYAGGTGAGRIGGVTVTPAGHRDAFTRADSSTSLGVTDNGEKWKANAGTWGINGNRAYLAAASGTRNVVTVSGAADGSFSFKMPTAQAGLGLVFRYADDASLLAARRPARVEHLAVDQTGRRGGDHRRDGLRAVLHRLRHPHRDH